MAIISQNTPKKISFLKSGYPQYFRRDVHKLLFFGYERVRPSINFDTEEPTITVRIAEEIDKGLDTIGLLPDSILKKRYNVVPEFPKIKLKDPLNIKDEYVRFDIVVLDSRTIPRRRYIVEAKRLRKNGFAIGKYCSDGIMRYIEDVYASEFPEAVMIAFWQDSDFTYWFGELLRKFNEDKKDNKMAVSQPLESIEIISEFSNEWVSKHTRKSGNEIILFHIFLESF